MQPYQLPDNWLCGGIGTERTFESESFTLYSNLPGNPKSYDIFMPLDSDTDLHYNR